MRTEYPHHLPSFSYLGIQRYFLTFCVDRRSRAFVEREIVDMVWSQFLRAASDEPFSIIACCFMPDHVHLLVEGVEDASDLKRFLSRAKQLSGYHYNQQRKKRLWQRYSYEHVLRDEESTPAVVAYILENPVRAGLAATVHEYPFIASSLYGREELIEYTYRSGGRGSASECSTL